MRLLKYFFCGLLVISNVVLIAYVVYDIFPHSSSSHNDDEDTVLIPVDIVFDVMRTAESSPQGITFDLSAMESYLPNGHPAIQPVDSAPSISDFESNNVEDSKRTDQLIDRAAQQLREQMQQQAQPSSERPSSEQFWPGAQPVPTPPADQAADDSHLVDPETGRIR